MTKLLIGLGVLIVIGALFSALQALWDKLFPQEAPPEEERTEKGDRLQAVVHCTGGGVGFLKYNYQGAQDCLAASRLPGGGALSCDYGCLGMGTCERVCPTGAIRVREGVAVVEGGRCVACGKCAEACPRHIIALESCRPPKHVSVPCASKEREETVSKFCANGCVGCSLCAGICPKEAISMEEGLARIDHEKCDRCGLCVNKCPRRLIREDAVEALPEPELPKPPRERKKPGRVKLTARTPGMKRLKKPEEKEDAAGEKEQPIPDGESLELSLAGVDAERVESAAEAGAPLLEAYPGEEKEPEEAPEEKESASEVGAGEIRKTSAEEAFQAFAQAVAAAGEALGERGTDDGGEGQ